MQEETQKCKGCDKDLPATSEYYPNERRNNNGLSGKCRKCHYARAKAWRKANPERAAKSDKKRHRKHYIKNADKIRAKSRARMATPEAKRRARERMRELRKDPVQRMRMNVSRKVRRALNGERKSKRTFEALNYTLEQLKEHLEAQFDEHMTWDNYGSYWHIDHIHPQSLLPYDSCEHPNFLKCWALDNLQPLEAKANITKGNKVIAIDV